MTETETRVAPRGGALAGLSMVLGHPVSVGLLAGIGYAFLSGHVLHAIGVGLLVCGLVWGIRRFTGGKAADRLAMLDALAAKGATHVGFSASDVRGIGYDTRERNIYLAQMSDGAPFVWGFPVDLVGPVTWSRPAATAVPVMAMHNPAAVMQANAANAANERRAREESGLRIELPPEHLPFFRIALDADAKRMQAWADLIAEAKGGRVPVPASVQTI